MLGAMTDTVVHCRYCGQLLRESDHPGFRWVHVHSGNGFCDVTDPESAVLSAWANPYGLRDSAEPV